MTLRFHLFTASELGRCYAERFEIEDLCGLDIFHGRFSPDNRWHPAAIGADPQAGWPSWLGLLTALPLWALGELSLSRKDGVAAPSHREIREALSGLGDRLGGTGTQLGVAAMTGVDPGRRLALWQEQLRKTAERLEPHRERFPHVGTIVSERTRVEAQRARR